MVRQVRRGIQSFDMGRTTCLQTDYSQDGIGFLLLQKYCSCSGVSPRCCPPGWKLCYVSSRFLSPAETRYKPIEGEMLGVVWSLKKARHWVQGCPKLVIATDHKPLLGVLNDRDLETIENPRMLALKEKTLAYNFHTIHLPGKRNCGADAASRNPTGRPDYMSIGALQERGEMPGLGRSLLRSRYSAPSSDDLKEAEELEKRVWESQCKSKEDQGEGSCCRVEQEKIALTWSDLEEASRGCKTTSAVQKLLEEGTVPAEEDQELGFYRKYWSNLSVSGDVVLFKGRVLVPYSCRDQVLQTLHQGHQGVTSMSLRAAGSVWWPGVTEDIRRKRAVCKDCDRNAPSQPAAPPSPLPSPDYPMQMLAADFFELAGHNYLVLVDRYSGWPSVFRSKAGEGAEELCKLLRDQFVTFGCPDEISSDGGPQFTSRATKDFLRKWGVRQRVSSAYFPHSNLRAEQGVKTMKRLLRGNVGPGGSLANDKVARALLNYRNTPDRDLGLSPAQVIFGRHIKDTLPLSQGEYKPRQEWLLTREMREQALAKRHLKQGDVWAEHTRELPDLKIGSIVQIQNQTGPRAKKWEKSGVVTEVLEHQQYNVKVDGSGRVTLRNRRFLRPITPFKPPMTRVAEESPGLAHGGPRKDHDKEAQKGSPERAGVGLEKLKVMRLRPRRALTNPRRYQAGQ